jgi:hypothetical protein
VPIHDWTRVPSGLFHHFHQDWCIELARTLNRGVLPQGYYALVEQRVDGPEPDVIAVETGRKPKPKPKTGTLVLDPPPTKLVSRVSSDAGRYARKANRICVYHPLDEVVAVIEIVSPGNKDSKNALRSFVDKAVSLLRNGIHLLIVDLFPPTERDPHGIHKAIWSEFLDEPFVFEEGQSRILVSYQAGEDYVAYVEPLAVSDAMPAMPLFLEGDEHVRVPLEETYQATWEACPEPIRVLVERPPS